MSKIYVTLSTFSEYGNEPLSALEKGGFPFTVNESGKRMTPKQIVKAAADSSVVIAGVEPYDASMLEAMPRLKAICRCGAGVDSVDLAYAKAHGIAVFNTPHHPIEAVAEMSVAMMLALVRRLPEQSLLIRERQWKRLKTHLLAKRKVGIIGLGKIGKRVTEILKVFGSRISGYDPYADKKWAKANSVTLLPLDGLLDTSDIVTIHASQFQDAPLKLGAKEIQRMKKGAILINCARGDMVDEGALIDALKHGKLGGAGIDVFEEEPYKGELTQLNNVVLTPHCSTLTVETRIAMELEAAATAVRFLRGDTDFINRVV
jgi:D-3-phosphoglycerate dehydrogenase / 2-oxoglutarate reductase